MRRAVRTLTLPAAVTNLTECFQPTRTYYKCGSLSGPRIRAALPAELVHRTGTMEYSGSIRRNK